MKKFALTIAIVLGLGIGAFAQYYNHQGGLFQLGPEPREYDSRSNDMTYSPLILPEHGVTYNQTAESPLGSGIAVLMGLGTAYLVAKRRKED